MKKQQIKIPEGYPSLPVSLFPASAGNPTRQADRPLSADQFKQKLYATAWLLCLAGEV
ncbi:hypothetical protein [Desulfobacter postgatei]|uniref:hypothetical protein n=1 Tax=Desulfobacter postgatei TaxID=2293 RepID=UPI002FDB0CBB